MFEDRTRIRLLRVDRLRSGNWQFGHSGRHHGSGRDDCPRELHHHHDEFCDMPTPEELWDAGIDPDDFKVRRRD